METLSYNPQKTYEYGSEWRTNVSTFGEGKEQRRKKYSASVKIFHWESPTCPVADADAIQAFFDARYGSYGAFYWVNPLDSVTYTVRFVSDSLKITYVNPRCRSVSFDLKEVK